MKLASVLTTGALQHAAIEHISAMFHGAAGSLRRAGVLNAIQRDGLLAVGELARDGVHQLRQQLRVVSPRRHRRSFDRSQAVLNWAIEERSSAANVFSCAAAAAACLLPTAYCRATSDTCVIAPTT